MSPNGGSPPKRNNELKAMSNELDNESRKEINSGENWGANIPCNWK